MTEDEKLNEWRERRREDWRRWRRNHKEDLRAKYQKKRLESPPKFRTVGWQVIALSDPRDASKKIRYVCLKHTTKTNIGWPIVFENCNRLNSKLSDWFQVLRAARVRPVESIILGVIPLAGRIAKRLLRALSERMRADLNEGPFKGRRRPIVAIDDSGALQGYDSIEGAARALNLHPDTVAKHLTLGRGIFDGRIRL